MAVLAYQIFTAFFAWINYRIIRKGGRIYHGLNGALHIIASLLIGYFTEWNYGVSCLIFTRVVFDTVLNIFRHKGVGYISPLPSSWVDKIEKKIVLWIATRGKVLISEERVQWTAIFFRIGILGLGVLFASI